MNSGERTLNALLMIFGAIGTLAILLLVLAVLDVIPRTFHLGQATYDVVWICVAAIVLEMAITTPIQLIMRAQRKAAERTQKSTLRR